MLHHPGLMKYLEFPSWRHRRDDATPVATNRRCFLAMVAGGLMGVAMPARSQPNVGSKRIVLLSEGPYELPPPMVIEGWRARGWIVGQNLFLDRRFAQRPEELPALAAELLAFNPDVIITFGVPAARAMKRATSTIPIIFNVGSDPVEAGLVASLARPGGNLTGYYNGLYDEKKLQYIKEIQPRAKLVAYLDSVGPRIEHAAHSLGMRAQGVRISGKHELERFFEALRVMRADAVVLPSLTWIRKDSVDLIASRLLSMRLPGIGANRNFAEAGGLMSFGARNPNANIFNLFDKLLRGANPAETPVELPTEFDLVINAVTASAIGLTVPKALELRADHVIR